MEARNRPWRGNEFENLIPSEGYTVVQPPEGYKPVLKRSSLAAPSAEDASGFMMQDDSIKSRTEAEFGLPPVPTSEGGALPSMKPEDYAYFGKLTEAGDSKEERQRRKKEGDHDAVLKIKNGQPAQRKVALRRMGPAHFGAGPLFGRSCLSCTRWREKY